MASPPALIEHLQNAFALLPRTPESILVAVSGGPDSVALLCGLSALGGRKLVVAHVNHGVRGQASDADELFVRGLCDRLGLPCRVKRVSPSDWPRANFEAAARELRYQWFAELAEAEGIEAVATGHSADDQSETILFHVLRGTGLAGLSGIAFSRPLSERVMLIRPLLSCPRADILSYLEDLGQPFQVDETNEDRSLTRNRIRHELLPFLRREYNPRISENLALLGEQAADCQREIDASCLEMLGRCEKPRAGAICVMDADTLSGIARPKLRNLWRFVWQRENWKRDGMGFREYDAVADVCLGKALALDCPGRIRIRRQRAVVQAGPIDEFEVRK